MKVPFSVTCLFFLQVKILLSGLSPNAFLITRNPRLSCRLPKTLQAILNAANHSIPPIPVKLPPNKHESPQITLKTLRSF